MVSCQEFVTEVENLKGWRANPPRPFPCEPELPQGGDTGGLGKKKPPSSKTKVTSLCPCICYLREDAISSGVASVIIAEVPNTLGARVGFKVTWTESNSMAEGSDATGVMPHQADTTRPRAAGKQTHLCKCSWVNPF